MAKNAARAATPAIAELVRLGIEFIAHEYTHDSTVTEYGQEAVTALAVSPERVCKTLVAATDNQLVVAVVPVAHTLDLKALAAAAGARKATMAEPRVAERKTGYVLGGISPLGQRTRLVTFIDESVLAFDTILVSAGRRGLDLEIAVADLVRACDAKITRVARK